METLLVFLAIIAIQMIAAYFAKQKKEVVQKETQKKIAPKPVVQRKARKEPELNEDKLEVKKQEIIIKEEIKEEKSIPQFSILNSQLNLKNPAHGILWNAILHEPRYRVKWKRK